MIMYIKTPQIYRHLIRIESTRLMDIDQHTKSTILIYPSNKKGKKMTLKDHYKSTKLYI